MWLKNFLNNELIIHIVVIDTHYYAILIHQMKISMICKVTSVFYLLQKRNQRWRSLEKRSDEIVKYIDIKNEIEKMSHVQEKQG